MSIPTLPSFDPAHADHSRAFRDALGQFGTGVTIVTCQTPDGPLGMTANSFASVSLDPPLVLWSPAKASRRYGPFIAAKRFGIHVIGADQSELCVNFARDGSGAFAKCDWEANTDGVPLLSGSLARFECAQEALHDAGDHTIIVARVTRVTTSEGAPLLFHAGRYGGFADAS
ncbi:flavin reductase family protein [Cognatishimia sp. F0-27]|uniref:flavin reductase family protein n=1 Tax=Cognatishimia sp. F0-27 TaxID=2816855 RepID=UPI001D0CCCBE|nr:flavin reductase family protein [Cognatishimia sp. F0-27]MCC1491997.1 flavin reductase family protein [Cognatishimia sp. F0-27]